MRAHAACEANLIDRERRTRAPTHTHRVRANSGTNREPTLAYRMCDAGDPAMSVSRGEKESVIDCNKSAAGHRYVCVYAGAYHISI